MNQKFSIIKVLLAVIVISSCYFVTVRIASAATLYLSSDKEDVGIGDTFEVIVKTDSEGVGLNAAQATLKFPKDLIEVTKVDTAASIFSFWLKEPSFSNQDGALDFIGGSNFGSSGKSLAILKVVFKAKGSGKVELVFSDGAITASDGSGTNVLSVMRGLEITSAPKAEVIEITPATTPPSAIPPPTQITRPPAPAQKLPVKPAVKVSFYPDPEKWYNSTANFMAQWELPPDVSAVSTALDQNISYFGQKSEGLFESKIFTAIKSDGVWYLHVRFKNNVGWGSSADYRLAIDTAPPLSFEVKSLEGEATDNPTTTLQFKTNDPLSGLKEYQIQIDEGDIIKIPASDFGGTFVLPLQSPGKRQVVVRAVDQAENNIEDNITLEIIPIASPTITFVTKELFSDEEKGLSIKGTALPNINVLLGAHRKDTLVAKGLARVDERGNWEFTFDEPFRNGKYKVSAQSQNTRGALSIIVESPEIRVKSKPIIQIGMFQLGKGGAAVLLLLIVITGFGGGIWFYRKRQEKLALRIGLTEFEIAKIFKLIREDIEKLSRAYQTPTTGDDEYAMKRLQENIQKMEVYLKKGVEKIQK